MGLNVQSVVRGSMLITSFRVMRFRCPPHRQVSRTPDSPPTGSTVAATLRSTRTAAATGRSGGTGSPATLPGPRTLFRNKVQPECLRRFRLARIAGYEFSADEVNTDKAMR